MISTHSYAPPNQTPVLPALNVKIGDYVLSFAQTEHALRRAQLLRFNVFNLELGEGLSESYVLGRDEDEFDATCHHLIITHTPSNDVIGTYRLQIAEMAAQGHGFYSNTEFDLSTLPPEVLNGAVELGRACIAKDHRVPQVLFLLWQGIAIYMMAFNKDYLFGCCSLTSQDPHEGKQVMTILHAQNAIHPNLHVLPRPEFECYPPCFQLDRPNDAKVPKLFRAYLRMGAKVLGPPAIDQQFKTIDYLVLFDRNNMSADAQKFFASGK